MDTNKVLSQDEMDALLQGLESGELQPGAAPVPPDVTPYDLAYSDNPLTGIPRVMGKIFENFSVDFRKRLAALLHRSVNVECKGTQRVEFSQYLGDMSAPQSLNVVTASPLKGEALIVLTPQLVSVVVDIFFGGDGLHPNPIVEREFTQGENRIVRIVLERAFGCLAEAWTPVANLNFEYVRSEFNPEHVDVAGPKEVVFVTSFRVSFDGAEGEVHFVVPYSMLEPITRHLRDRHHDVQGENKDWPRLLRLGVEETEVELTGVLANTELTLRDIVNLKVGDVIKIAMPEHIPLSVESVPAFLGAFGQHSGNNAVRITHKLLDKGCDSVREDGNGGKQ